MLRRFDYGLCCVGSNQSITLRIKLLMACQTGSRLRSFLGLTACVFLAAAIGRGSGRLSRQFWLRVGHASKKLSILNLIFTQCGEAIVEGRLCSDCRNMSSFRPALFIVGQTVLADMVCR